MNSCPEGMKQSFTAIAVPLLKRNNLKVNIMPVYVETYYEIRFLVPCKFQNSESIDKLERIFKGLVSETAALQVSFCSQSFSFQMEKLSKSVFKESKKAFEYLDSLETLD